MSIDSDRYRIEPGKKLDLSTHDPADRAGFSGDKDEGKARLAELNARLGDLQESLYAEGKHSVLVVLQAMDAGGKDGTIRSVFEGVNPQGVVVHSFKAPTELERSHDFLWRIHAQTSRRGHIAIFNRSHYEDVLVARVRELVPKTVWRQRFGHIVAFEKLLHDEGTTIVKLFLNIGKEEQKQRLQERIDDPHKRWKWNDGDIEERKLWDEYMRAYEDAIAKTSTRAAPWYVVPADRNWYRNLVVSHILVQLLEQLDIQIPESPPGLELPKIE